MERIVQVMTFEDFHNEHFSIFSECPHILIQAAADPQFLNKCPGTPLSAMILLPRNAGDEYLKQQQKTKSY
jgi:hypothetical protein